MKLLVLLIAGVALFPETDATIFDRGREEGIGVDGIECTDSASVTSDEMLVDELVVFSVPHRDAFVVRSIDLADGAV